MLIVPLLVVGSQALLRGRVRSSAAFAIVSVIVLSAYLLGSRFIERRHPPEFAGVVGAWEFAQGLALGVALFCSVMGVLWAAGA